MTTGASIVRAMGVKEFAAKVRMASPNVLGALNPEAQSNAGNNQSFVEAVRAASDLAVVEGSKRSVGCLKRHPTQSWMPIERRQAPDRRRSCARIGWANVRSQSCRTTT